MRPEGGSPTRSDELQAHLSGVFAPICTPFAENEDVDDGALRFNLGRYAPSGIVGYLALGSSGENRSLTEEERLRVLDVVVRGKAAGQVVLAGATNDQDQSSLLGAAMLGRFHQTGRFPIPGQLATRAS